MDFDDIPATIVFTRGLQEAPTVVTNLLYTFSTAADLAAGLAALPSYSAVTGIVDTALATVFNLDEQDPRSMKLYHYGDPDIVITPESDFGFKTGTITGYTGSNPDIVLPYEINGVPVVAIGDNAFQNDDVVKTIKASKALTSIGDYAFDFSSLVSFSAPALTTIGDYAFDFSSLVSFSAPALTTIGNQAFASSLLTTLVAPALTTLDDYAFSGSSLTTVYYGGNQPTAGVAIYEWAPTNLVSYVTDPTATGWGDFFGGRPVVRLPLYGSSVTAQAYTLNGDTITEWPEGGGETSIIAPLYESGTNVTVTSTQSVYSVSVTGAGPVGIDWSGLALDGTGRAEVTLRLNVTEWGRNKRHVLAVADLRPDPGNPRHGRMGVRSEHDRRRYHAGQADMAGTG